MSTEMTSTFVPIPQRPQREGGWMNEGEHIVTGFSHFETLWGYLILQLMDKEFASRKPASRLGLHTIPRPLQAKWVSSAKVTPFVQAPTIST
jgi:hypothetical protein